MLEFLFVIIGGIVSSVLSTYLIRFLDRIKRKNDRHEK